MKLSCVVDNTVALSTPLWGEHGLAVVVEAAGGRVLFDTGASGTVLLHNLALLNLTPDTLDLLVLSHGHYDHSGGLALFLEQRPGLPLYAHPGVLNERYNRSGEDYHPIGIPIQAEMLKSSAELHLGSEYTEVMPGVWTTGQIYERPEPEGRGKGHVVPNGSGFVPDPYEDDQALVLRGKDGLTLLCGCCHAGLLNTIEHVRRVFGEYPRIVVGGTHLASADEGYLAVAARRLAEAGITQIYPCHCTGLRAGALLANLLGNRVIPWAAGSELLI